MSLFVSDALAQTTTSTAAPTPAEAGIEVSANKMMLDNLMLLAAVFFIFYFILLRPQQQRMKAHKDLVSKLKKGDKVITSGGLLGSIAKLEGDHVVVLEVAQGVKVRVSRASITELSSSDTSESANDN